MYNLPEELECPKCRNHTPQYLDEYDIDCGETFEGNGVVSLSCYCGICEHEWKYRFKVTIKEI